MKQSTITYNKDNLTITIEGMDEVAKALDDLKKKTPAAAKVAINATAREARKLMIAQAKARYAVNAKGAQHLKDLKTSGRRDTTPQTPTWRLCCSSKSRGRTWPTSSTGPRRAFPGGLCCTTRRSTCRPAF